MTVSNFEEVLGTEGFDSISGSDLEIVYALEGDDVLNSFPTFSGGSLPNGGETTILVGGTGDNAYQIRNNSTAFVVENKNSQDNILWTTIGNGDSVGIGLDKPTSFFQEIDNRHLYLGDTASDQYAILIDWQTPENQIETFDLVEGRIGYDDFADRFRDSQGYQGNITWSELAAQELIDLQRLDLAPAAIDDVIDTVIARAEELETNNSSSSIGNFEEVLGTEGFDSISGSDLEIVYALEGDDVLNSFPTFSGGSLPNGGETTILVGGTGDNAYQIRNNSTAFVVENKNSQDNILWTTIGNGDSVGIGLDKPSSFFQEIDNRHLYLGDTASDQYAILIDWQTPENQIETFDLVEGRIGYDDFADRFRDSQGYQGNITWSEFAAPRDFERFGIDITSIDEVFEQINNRATELETASESEDLLETDIFRFQNTSVPGTYLYAAAAEAENIRANFTNFTEEGLAFQVATEPGEALIALYRFQSKVTPGTYIFVAEPERQTINNDFSESFREEGLAFYVYGAGADKATPFSRFQNTANPGTYLFADPSESVNIERNFPNFANEGIAFEVDI